MGHLELETPMTIVNPAFTLLAHGGGTVTTTDGATPWCRLTDTRMVVAYWQKTPNAGKFGFIDNPDGLESTTTPSVFTMSSYIAASETVPSWGTKMLRLNDTTFVLIYTSDQNYVNFQVYSVSGDTITRVTATNYYINNAMRNGRNGSFTYPVYNTVASPQWAAAPLADNTFTFATSSYVNYFNSFFPSQRDSAQSFLSLLFTWNPQTATLSFIEKYNSKFAGGGEDNYYYGITYPRGMGFYMIPTAVPNEWFVNLRLFSNSPGTTRTSNNVYNHWYRIRADGSVAQLTNYAVNLELLEPITGKSALMTYASTQYNEVANQTTITSYTVPAPAANDMNLYAPFSLRLDSNYYAMMDYRPFYRIGSLDGKYTLKIMRRADDYITESAPGTPDYGAVLTTPNQILSNNQDARPFVTPRGNIMWAGSVFTPNREKFAYAVVVQPSLPASPTN